MGTIVDTSKDIVTMAFLFKHIARLNLGTRQISVNRSSINMYWKSSALLVQDNGGTGIYTPDDASMPIPKPKERPGETIDVKRARLIYQSRKRGMLENGILLSAFAARYVATMADHQLELYDKLINEPSNDWEIYYWAIGQKEVPEEYDSEVMTLLKKFTKNEDNECRLHQPPLN